MNIHFDDYFNKLPKFLNGWVWLVGAGPGDPGLLTLHALHALRHADVIVYDALVEEASLQFAKPSAELIFAGKRGGKPSPVQADISEKLISLAQSGKKVLRLKGGDPFIFGRGGEEALALVKANVRFKIIPGISAGIGGLAYAGIPLTHRDINSAVTFVTGHSLSGDVPDNLNWQALVQGSPVLVFYMALKHIEEIAHNLLTYGKSVNQPVALVSAATTERQKVSVGVLSQLVELASQVESPAIIVVGDVVELRPLLLGGAL